MGICLSGGAEGADRRGGLAAVAGHEVCPFTFSGCGAPRWATGIKLTQEQLGQADVPLLIANRTLKRQFPTKSLFVNNLLRRNWWQVCDTSAVYAVGYITPDNLVAGGTAWAVQMYRNRFANETGVYDPARLYLFEQELSKGLTATYDGWLDAGPPPKPSGRWDGIGSCKLTPEGEAAIAGVFV